MRHVSFQSHKHERCRDTKFSQQAHLGIHHIIYLDILYKSSSILEVKVSSIIKKKKKIIYFISKQRLEWSISVGIKHRISIKKKQIAGIKKKSGVNSLLSLCWLTTHCMEGLFASRISLYLANKPMQLLMLYLWLLSHKHDSSVVCHWYYYPFKWSPWTQAILCQQTGNVHSSGKH